MTELTPVNISSHRKFYCLTVSPTNAHNYHSGLCLSWKLISVVTGLKKHLWLQSSEAAGGARLCTDAIPGKRGSPWSARGSGEKNKQRNQTPRHSLLYKQKINNTVKVHRLNNDRTISSTGHVNCHCVWNLLTCSMHASIGWVKLNLQGGKGTTVPSHISVKLSLTIYIYSICHKTQIYFQLHLYTHGRFSAAYLKGNGTISSENISHNVCHNISF